MERKAGLREQIQILQDEIGTRATFCVAGGVNRVARIAAHIIRLSDSRCVLGRHLIVLGGHAIYAYDTVAGVLLQAGLLQTSDLNTLPETKADLEIAGDFRSTGLLGLLQKIDKTFRLTRQQSWLHG